MLIARNSVCKVPGLFSYPFGCFGIGQFYSANVRNSELKTVCVRTMETASTREQDFRFETVSKKSRNDFMTETETETMGPRPRHQKTYLEMSRDRDSVSRQFKSVKHLQRSQQLGLADTFPNERRARSIWSTDEKTLTVATPVNSLSDRVYSDVRRKCKFQQ